MNWSSPSEFLAMGGYGLYVWGSYVAMLVLMVVEPLAARRRHRQALHDAADEAAADGSRP